MCRFVCITFGNNNTIPNNSKANEVQFHMVSMELSVDGLDVLVSYWMNDRLNVLDAQN